MMSKFVLVAAVCAILASVAFATPLQMALDDDIIAEVNKQPGWTAGHNQFFEGMSMEDARALLGTKLRPLRLPVKSVEALQVGAIPTSFDSRTQWPGCIHPIRDQGQCGSCWAFGATEALSDRLCIATKGSVNVVLSPQYLVSCDKSNHACNGGYLDKAWTFMKTTGVVSDACVPYTSGSRGAVPACMSKCSGSGSFTKHNAKSVYAVSKSASAIQSEIMTYGPVEAGFEVYADFMSYTGGVYQHRTGSLQGGHAIKIIGWGVDGSTPYWLVANSWGPTWGMSGFFKILRGKNECGIESNVVAGLAGSSSSSMTLTPITQAAAVEY